MGYVKGDGRRCRRWCGKVRRQYYGRVWRGAFSLVPVGSVGSWSVPFDTGPGGVIVGWPKQDSVALTAFHLNARWQGAEPSGVRTTKGNIGQGETADLIPALPAEPGSARRHGSMHSRSQHPIGEKRVKRYQSPTCMAPVGVDGSAEWRDDVVAAAIYYSCCYNNMITTIPMEQRCDGTSNHAVAVKACCGMIRHGSSRTAGCQILIQEICIVVVRLSHQASISPFGQ